LLEQGFEPGQILFRCDHVQNFYAAVFEVFDGGAGVVAVVALAGEDENQVVRAGEFAGAAGDFLADAPDDLGLGLAGVPRGALPLAHLGDVDDRDGHGTKGGKFFAGAKEN